MSKNKRCKMLFTLYIFHLHLTIYLFNPHFSLFSSSPSCFKQHLQSPSTITFDNYFRSPHHIRPPSPTITYKSSIFYKITESNKKIIINYHNCITFSRHVRPPHLTASHHYNKSPHQIIINHHISFLTIDY